MANFNLDNYVPVSERLEKFYGLYPNGRINTSIEQTGADGLVIFKAAAYRERDDAEPSATGHAYEVAGSNYINKTSYIENCETSAIGRALANMGIEVSRGIASREEMQKVERMQTPPKDAQEPTKRDQYANVIKKAIKELNESGDKWDGKKWDAASLNAFIADLFGDNINTTNANEAQMSTIAQELAKRLANSKETK